MFWGKRFVPTGVPLSRVLVPAIPTLLEPHRDSCHPSSDFGGRWSLVGSGGGGVRMVRAVGSDPVLCIGCWTPFRGQEDSADQHRWGRGMCKPLGMHGFVGLVVCQPGMGRVS